MARIFGSRLFVIEAPEKPPGPDARWHVSRRVEPRRSRGEEDLFRLDGQPLIPPAESAYAPAPEALRWRLERLAG